MTVARSEATGQGQLDPQGLEFTSSADWMAEALLSEDTQATDLAERLVRRGIPFRSAYQAVGALVHAARKDKKSSWTSERPSSPRRAVS
jgi:argininosuccinate lyase